MKKLLALLLALTVSVPILPIMSLANAVETSAVETNAKAVILMEKESGEALYAENAHEPLEPASVTKVMTMLLIMEALDEGRIAKDELVTTSATAAGMGGSQVFLKEGEQMTVDDMLKAIAVASGNDASVAMAEHLAGSEAAFVQLMNERAAELGMADTVFHNCTGLPAEGHLTSAHDIALVSRALILNHPGITDYTSIWMDTLRGGAFQLANTNKLIYYYKGATGLKTGSTDAALYCLAATAMRDGVELIAVVLGAPTSADRFESAKSLLNYGFAKYTLIDVQPTEPLPPVLVELGVVSSVQPVPAKPSRILVEKSSVNDIQTEISLAETVEAPVEAGQTLGEMIVSINGEEYEVIPLVAAEEVPRLGCGQILMRLVDILLTGRC